MYTSTHGTDPPCCANCRYFQPLSPKQVEQGAAGPWEEDALVGRCVRYPPQFFHAELLNGEWPVVNSEEYCGEHSRDPHV